MVSRAPQYEGDSVSAGQGNGSPAQTQIRDAHGQGNGTPRQPKKEVGTPKPAQDVAELKDYVWHATTLDYLVQEISTDPLV